MTAPMRRMHRFASATLAACMAGALFVAGCAAVLPKAKQHFDLQAHRGGRGLAPENTLPAFSQAIDAGREHARARHRPSRPTAWSSSRTTSRYPDHAGAMTAPAVARSGKSGANVRSLTLDAAARPTTWAASPAQRRTPSSLRCSRAARRRTHPDLGCSCSTHVRSHAALRTATCASISRPRSTPKARTTPSPRSRCAKRCLQRSQAQMPAA
jgi:hypothetical protein